MLERKWWTLIVVCMGTFMLLLDVSIVNVALPAIERDLDASFADLQWVIDAYALTLASFLLTGGSLADRLGRKRIFLAGLLVFTVASLLCGLAGSPLFLNANRALQGVGGAAMFATALAIIGQTFSGTQRGTALGIWGATIGAALAIGPLIGGVLTDGLGWEWIFFVNIPIGLAVAGLAVVHVVESRDPRGGQVDWIGLVTFSSALGLLVYAMIRGNELGWGSTTIVALLSGTVVLLGLFILAEARQREPMLDLTLFRKPTFAGGAIAAFALHASLISLFLFFTLYFQNILGYSPLDTGLRFLPVTLVAFLVAPLAGRLSGHVIPVRVILGGGLALIGVGCVVAGGVKTGDDWTVLLAGMVMGGVGIGIVNPALATTAIGVVAPERSGMASGINSTFRQVGIACGIAGLGAIFQARVESRLTELLAGTPVGSRAPEIASAVASGGGSEAIATAPAPVRATVARAAEGAFVTGLNDILVVAAVVAFVGALLTFVLVRARDFLEEEPIPELRAEGETAVAGRTGQTT